MNELALFAGAGGGILGGNLLGWQRKRMINTQDAHDAAVNNSSTGAAMTLRDYQQDASL